MKYKIGDIELKEMVKNSISYAQVLKKSNMHSKGGAYKTIKNRIMNLGIDVSHFTSKKHGTSINFNKKSLSEILVINSNYASYNLKRRLIKENLLENKCSECGQPPEWNGKPLTLQLDHINGINNDNRLENLRLLCPNCHTQTETYCKGSRQKIINNCLDCNIEISKKSKRCMQCDAKSRIGRNLKIEWPSDNDLLEMLQKYSMVSVAKKLGISDNSIRKHLKSNKLV